MRETHRNPELPTDMGDLITIATLESERILEDSPHAVVTSIDPRNGETIEQAAVASALPVFPRILDPSYTLTRRWPADGSAPVYTFSNTRGGITTSCSWQRGGERMRAVLDINGVGGEAQASLDIATMEVQRLIGSTAYNPETEVIVTSLGTNRQKIVRKSTIVTLAQKIGWYF